jgi:SAM-dependent methyltransferase
LEAPSVLLDAACGVGRYDGMLLEAGHRVLGIDQSSSILVRARENNDKLSAKPIQ